MMKWITALSGALPAAAATVAPTALPTSLPSAESALASLPLFTKGLLTTVMGLLGVFLVLTLFFITIKLMQKIGVKNK